MIKWYILLVFLFIGMADVSAQRTERSQKKVGSSKTSTSDTDMKNALREARKESLELQKKKKNFSAEKQYALAKEKYYEKMYLEAINILEEVNNQAPSYADAWFLKADIIRKQVDQYGKYDIEKEVHALASGLEVDSTSYPIYTFFLAEGYFALGKYGIALSTYEKYLRIDKHSRRINDVNNRMLSCEFAIDALARKSSSYKKPVKYLEEESWDCYGPTFDMRQNLFMYTVREKNVYQHTNNKNGTRVQDTVQTEVDNENIYILYKGRKVPFSYNMPQYNEGMPSVTASGQQMYFCGCGGSDRNPQCDIFVCNRENEYVWGEPKNVGTPVCTDAWEAQPAISPDGRRLCFVSNRKDGIGQSDIWVTTISKIEKGVITWNEPECLWINTKGREMSPFIASDNHTLFFASDGLIGMGGLDIYYVDLDEPGSEPINIGIEVNSNTDQSGLIVDPQGKMVYFASQDAKTNKISIYRNFLPETIDIKPLSYMTIDIVDNDDKRVVPNQLMIQCPELRDTVNFYNAAGYFPDTLLTLLPPDKDILINAVRDGFEYVSDTLSTGHGTYDKPQHHTVHMKYLKEFESIVLNGIFFDSNSNKLDSASMCELQQLTFWLRKNPTVGIIIRGYTDNVGSESYNQRLSEDRAFEVYKYLLMHYIHKDRVQFEGYGSQYPRESNNTSEGRAKNRRVEMYIENMFGFYDY